MEHQPSKATIKFMQKIDTTIELMKKDISMILKGQEDNATEHKEIMKCLSDFIEKADKKYAPKWVADAFKWMVAFAAVTLFGIVGYLLDKFVFK